MTSTASPSLSVVISTRDRVSEILSNIDGLKRQVAAVGGELIVVSGAPDDDDTTPADVRVRRLPEASVFDCRAAGVSLAAADIVALTEDHCVHPDDWCARILEDFARNRDLVLLGGAVANGSTARLEDRMNYWMTFATFAPGQVTARHPCIAQFAVRKSALELPLQPGALESAVIQKFQKRPGAILVDPKLEVRHDQSHGFWNTFAVHFHNGRATGGLSSRRPGGRNLSVFQSLGWAWSDSRAHLRRTAAAFRAGGKSRLATAGYLLLILPLVIAHGVGELVGYRTGPGKSAERLV